MQSSLWSNSSTSATNTVTTAAAAEAAAAGGSATSRGSNSSVCGNMQHQQSQPSRVYTPTLLSGEPRPQHPASSSTSAPLVAARLALASSGGVGDNYATTMATRTSEHPIDDTLPTCSVAAVQASASFPLLSGVDKPSGAGSLADVPLAKRQQQYLQRQQQLLQQQSLSTEATTTAAPAKARSSSIHAAVDAAAADQEAGLAGQATLVLQASMRRKRLRHRALILIYLSCMLLFVLAVVFLAALGVFHTAGIAHEDQEDPLNDATDTNVAAAAAAAAAARGS